MLRQWVQSRRMQLGKSDHHLVGGAFDYKYKYMGKKSEYIHTIQVVKHENRIDRRIDLINECRIWNTNNTWMGHNGITLTITNNWTIVCTEQRVMAYMFQRMMRRKWQPSGSKYCILPYCRGKVQLHSCCLLRSMMRRQGELGESAGTNTMWRGRGFDDDGRPVHFDLVMVMMMMMEMLSITMSMSIRLYLNDSSMQRGHHLVSWVVGH